MKKKLSVPIGLSLAVCLLTIAMSDVAQAYPSRTGNCGVCHSRTDPPVGDADLDIQEADGTSTNLFEVLAGDSTEFVFEITDLPLVDPPPTDPEDPIHRRFYLVLDQLDHLNVGVGGSAEDLPYSPMLYTAPDADEGTWHNHRGDHQYISSNGSYYTISDRALVSIPFRLTLDPVVSPGDYELKATLVGGRPHAGEGWHVVENFTLRVVSPSEASLNIPEPASLALLTPGAILAGLCVWRRRKRIPQG